MTAKKKTIVICSSAAFYEHVNEIAGELEEMIGMTNAVLEGDLGKIKL
jgi:hypothetical protein